MDILKRLENSRHGGMGAIQSTLHAMVYEKKRNFDSSANSMNFFRSQFVKVRFYRAYVFPQKLIRFLRNLICYLNLMAAACAFPRSKPVLPPPLSPQVPSSTERTIIASAPILAASS